MNVAREILRLHSRNKATLKLIFSVFDMPHNIFSYLVNRKMKVYSDVRLWKKKSCVFWEIDPESR